MSSEFTFGDNSDKSSIFLKKIMNLVDRDPDHSDSDTVTTHTQQVDWSRQAESDCSLTRNKLTGSDKGNPTVHSHATS